jgi:hypothetical protein
MVLLTIAGVAIGAFGIIVTVVFAVRYAERKDPKCYSVTYLKIAVSEDAPHDIHIAYKGTRVERVASTFVWFWNAGRKPIRREDITETKPILLRVLNEGGHAATILDFALRKTSRDGINFRVVKQDDTTLRLAFDFLDFNDGAVIEVQHNGSATSSPEMSGIVLGAPRGIRSTTPPRTRRQGPQLPSLAAQYQHRPSRRTQVIESIVATLLLGVVPFTISVILRGDLSISRDQLRTALQGYLTGDALTGATAAIETAARASRGEVIATVGTLAFLWLLFMLGIWLRGHDFPDSLLLGKPEKKDDLEPTWTTYVRERLR